MQLPNRQRFALFLMAFSLGLLALFLGLFVRKIYQDELATLKRESSLLFVNSVRGIEGELFDKLLLRGGGTMHNAFQRDIRIQAGPAHRDSLQVFTYIQKHLGDDSAGLRSDTTLRIKISDGQPLTGNPEMRGALSVIVAMGDRRVEKDSFSGLPPLDSARIFQLLEGNFSQSIGNAGLPVHFRLLRMQKDSSNLTSQEFIAGSYTDLASGEQYGAALSNYQPYLFRQILPQLLFALLLFSCVSLAFLFIFQTLRQQQRLAEQKDDFVRNMTHELKTPIATVSVAVEALQNFDALQDRSRSAEYLQIARLELARLSLLVDKVLRLALFEQNKPVFQAEPLDLKVLVEEILQSMQLQFDQAGAEVHFASLGPDFKLRGDKMHLTGIVYNLLDNALKYSPLSPKINIDLTRKSGALVLQVSDQGTGIAAAHHKKIFDRFFRVPSGDVHNVKGHGLGLSYVAEVVDRHGGQIEVKSALGEGASFSITLPQN